MPSIPVVPIALVASLGALYYVDNKYKTLKTEAAPDKTEAAPKKKKDMEMKKKIRLGLMVTSVALCIAIIYNASTKRNATSSYENRVANAANSLRSSMNLSSARHQPPEDDFSRRVSEAAAKLRQQIAATPSSSMQPSSASDLAAKASAEISQFISDNS